MDSLNLSGPQFSQTEPVACRHCKQPVLGPYYVANGAVICHLCGERLKQEGPQENPGTYLKALILGLVAAGIGLAIYAAFAIASGMEIGYLSFAVGFIVGKGMMLASKGIGGRRYQITAVLLTYAAVSMASIPIAWHQISITKEKVESSQAQNTSPEGKAASNDAPDHATPSKDQDEQMTFAQALGRLALFGLASPFLELADGFNGVIGLIILFVGMRIAWQITGHVPLQISGPFDSSGASAASAG